MLRLLFLVGLAFAGVVVLSLHAPVRHASSRQLQIAKKCNPIRLNTQKENEEPSEKNKYLKHQCKSCSYVYDEEKGFKKRFPPGTRFSELKTFMCPVCGAAKDQFTPVD